MLSGARKCVLGGEEGILSVLVVSLLDVHIFELARKGMSEKFTSYAHTFVLGVGPEGVVIWQGWGEHGYPLDRYIRDGGARVRSWQETGDFVDRFEIFAAFEVSHFSRLSRILRGILMLTSRTNRAHGM